MRVIKVLRRGQRKKVHERTTRGKLQRTPKKGWKTDESVENKLTDFNHIVSFGFRSYLNDLAIKVDGE